MKRALVTGSAGLIGRHMTRRLLLDGWQVTTVDLQQPGGMQDCRQFFWYHQGERYDLVVHCAAVVGGRECIEGEQLRIAAVNYQLDAALFEWALRSRPGHIIYWSSSAAYPVAYQSQPVLLGVDPLPLAESDIRPDEPMIPDLTYGAVKLAGEQMAALANAAGIATHVLRPFSGWAEDQDRSYPMGAFLERAAQRADPFVVWGSGHQVRDFIHVDDVVATALAMVELDHRGPLNVCTGVGTSFLDLAAMVCAAAGYWPTISPQTDRPTGVSWRVGDPTEMHKVWTPPADLSAYVIRAVTKELIKQ